MHLFLKIQEVGLWPTIADGDYVPMAISSEESTSTKSKEAWPLLDQQEVLLNFKAYSFLSCALSKEGSEIFNCI
jgi:hypothetical protein